LISFFGQFPWQKTEDPFPDALITAQIMTSGITQDQPKIVFMHKNVLKNDLMMVQNVLKKY
jgi:hypothetical protein